MSRRSQRGGGKIAPTNNLNTLTKRMGKLRFGAKTKTVPKFGMKSNRRKTLKKKSVLKVITHKPKKPVKTLRSFVKVNLARHENQPLNMEQFEPAEYIRKVGGVFKGLGATRSRIEEGAKAHYLDDFDMVLTNIYEGLPTIQTVLGMSMDESMNGSDETIDGMLRAIASVGQHLIQEAKTYSKQVRASRANLSNTQVHLIAVADAVNQVLVRSVAEVARANVNHNMNGLVAALGGLSVKGTSVDDLVSLLSGLGL